MKTAFQSTNLLLPKKGTDMEKWAVIACDQFTSNPEYWDSVKCITQDAPSTLNLILPEIYLTGNDLTKQLTTIKESMDSYLKLQLFTEYKNAMIYLERTTNSGEVRAGLIGVLDLEEYDFKNGSHSQIRATEATVIDRLPPRIDIRKSASLEFSHAMVLIDDKKQTVIEPFREKTDHLEKLYDFSLMKDGGKIRGYLLNDEEIKNVSSSLETLLLSSSQEESSLHFAIGDGNHSLAAAKQMYEDLKNSEPETDFSNHPARYALVELVNLHSPALKFEAIYRILTEVDIKVLTEKLKNNLGLQKFGEGQQLSIVINGIVENFVITKPTSKIAVGSLQNFLDAYLAENSGKIDYIHGKENLIHLTQQPDSIGFLLPDMKKEDLFPTVIADGTLPRKTFSMGHAEDKRYYLECRKIGR